MARYAFPTVKHKLSQRVGFDFIEQIDRCLLANAATLSPCRHSVRLARNVPLIRDAHLPSIQWMRILPCRHYQIRQPNQWYQSINGKPGFTAEAISALQARVTNSEVICSLMIDEMSIRKHVGWTPHPPLVLDVIYGRALKSSVLPLLLRAYEYVQ